MDKEERKKFLNEVLDARGVKEWGRASEIVRRTGVSQATANGWLQGSLPQDPRAMLRMCDAFTIPMRTWIDGSELLSEGEQNGLKLTRLIRAIMQVDNFKSVMNLDMPPQQTARAIAYLYSLDEEQNFLEGLTAILGDEPTPESLEN